MSVIAVDFDVTPPTGSPWVQAAASFGPSYYTAYITSSIAVGDLLVVCLCYKFFEGDSPAPPYTLTDEWENDWTTQVADNWTDLNGNIWGAQIFWAIANSDAISLDTIYFHSNCPAHGDENNSVLILSAFRTYGYSIVADVSAGAVGTSSDAPGITLDTASPYPILVSVLMETALGGEGDFSISVGAGFSNISTGGLAGSGDPTGDSAEYRAEFFIGTYVPPPPVPPPLRYKKIPQTHDFASTTWDQANRLALYELLRSLGLDSSGLGSLSSWCVTLFPEITGQPYSPLTTLNLSVWSEAVDANWNILKNALLGAGGGPGPLCGRHITIDPTVNVEYAGEWEVMAMSYQPFKPDIQTDFGGDITGTVNGIADVPRTPASGSGVITLTLRTYDERVLGLDTSQTASYLILPGPIIDDPFE